MSDRTDLPKIKPTDAPSIFNSNMGVGAMLGQIIGYVPPALMHNKRMATTLGLVGTAVGAVWSGLSEKAKQEKEMTEGRVVKDPGYWNKGLLSGLVFGAFGMIVPVVGPVVLIGAMIGGSIMRKNSLQRDYDASVAIRDANQAKTTQLLQQVAERLPGKETSYKNSVSADEAAVLADKQKPTTTHADQLAQTASQEGAARSA